MIAQTFSFLVLVAVASASVAVVNDPYKPMAGVDPNTLSCDPTGQTFLLLPHNTECKKFYMCDNGAEVEFSCAPGNIIFDFELQGCNWVSDTQCWLRDEDLEGSGDDEVVSGDTDSVAFLKGEAIETAHQVSGVTAQVFNSILNCNRPDSAIRQVPYNGDCQRYWRCVSGVPQVSYCSDGLFFNEKTQQCDFEANSRCAEQPEDELRGEFIVYE